MLLSIHQTVENDLDINECRTEEAGDLSRWQATTCDMPGSGTDSAWCVWYSLQVCPDLHWTCQLVHLDQDVKHHWHIWLRQPDKVVVAEYRFNHDGQL